MRFPFPFLCLAGCLPSFFPIALAEVAFDYHSIQKHPAAGHQEERYEGEFFDHRPPASVQPMGRFGQGWSAGSHLLWHGIISDQLTLEFEVIHPAEYEISVQLTKAPDYGLVGLTLGDFKASMDLYAPKVELAPLLRLGSGRLEAGTHTLTLKLSGANPNANHYRKNRYLVGLDYLELKDLTPPPAKPNPEPAELPLEEGLKPAKVIAFHEMRALMSEHCFRCHGDQKEKGKLNLESMTARRDFLADIETSEAILDALRESEMPPDDEPQPSAQETSDLITWFSQLIDHYLESSSSELEPVVMRRLNRYEYNNAVRDLLDLKGDIYPLPEKTIRSDDDYYQPARGRFPRSLSVGNRTLGKFQVEQEILPGVTPFAIDLQAEHGFNNRGDELGFPPILLESFLTLGKAIALNPKLETYSRDFKALFAPVSGKDDLAIGRQRLNRLLERAFRTVPDPEMSSRYERFFESKLAESGAFETAMRETVAAVLASPRFLYLSERRPDQGNPAPLSGSWPAFEPPLGIRPRRLRCPSWAPRTR
ncbi:MAG: DUF1595 domain-containing protein, partial [Verrucomicrobiota bacterium]